MTNAAAITIERTSSVHACERNGGHEPAMDRSLILLKGRAPSIEGEGRTLFGTI